MSQGLYDSAPQEVLEARPISVRHAKEIAEFCNKKFGAKGGTMAGLTASLLFQTIVTSLVVGIHSPGSAEGEAMIRDLYENALNDALLRWQGRDLKHHFGTKK